MPDSKISNLTELAESPDSVDELVIVDKSDTTMAATGTTKKITKANLVPQITPASSSAPASLDLHEDTDNGTNKITVTAPSAIASNKTLTLPDATDTLVGKATTDILTNKTLTSPVIQDWDGWQVANETWTYSSVDDPTGVITVPSGATSKYSVGMRIKFVNSGNTIYGIITAVTDTTIKFLHEIDPTDSLALHLMANSAITANYYSTQKSPFGFPVSTLKWTVQTQSTNGFSQVSPTKDVWYNAKSITVPIGCWRIEYIATIFGSTTASKTAIRVVSTLSTANNSEDDTGMSQTVGQTGASGALVAVGPVGSIGKIIDISSKSIYYLNVKTTTASADVSDIGLAAAVGTTIRATCSYL